MPAPVKAGAGPRPVFCPIGHGHRDRAVAENVRAGRFTFGGITLDLGVEPDWLEAPLPSDPEWRIAWSKFYYGLDLAAAYAGTGEASFLEAWERLVASWIRTVPVGWDRSDVAGRRIQNWIYAWCRFAGAPGFTGLRPGIEEQLIGSLTAQAEHVAGHLTRERNHRTLELYALFVFALAFPGNPASGPLLDLARDELFRNLLTDFRADGVHCESSTHYHLVALRSMLGALENARRFRVALPSGFAAAAEKASEFALHIHRPDGGIPALSDSDGGSFHELLSLAASLFGRQDLLYVATAGREGAPPFGRQVGFPDGGYWIQRSGWGDGRTTFRDERFLVFDCGPLGEGSHGHYDLLNIEVSGHGKPLVVDPGRFTYEEASPSWRHWFKGTAGHNTVVVDGLDQTPYGRSRPRGPVAEGRFLGRATSAGLDMLLGEAMSPCYDAVHRRRIVMVAGEWWLVEDHLSAPTPHHYELRFHLAPDAQGTTAVERCEGGCAVVAPGVTLTFPSPLGAVLKEGWVSPEYGTKVQAPVVAVELVGCTATFVTLIAPGPARTTTPRIAKLTLAESTTTVEIEGLAREGGRDVVAWGPPGGWLAPGGTAVRAEIAWSRLSHDGAVVESSAAGATGHSR